jgi:protein Tex
MDTIVRRIAGELGVREQQVEAAIRLLADGATVPFIARYRKEVTGGLDDAQLRTLEQRLHYLREFEERRAAILRNIAQQGRLTPELRAAINAAETKARLEDLYLPFKPKKRSRATTAREAGLEPLAHALLGDPTLQPEEEAARYVDPARNVPDAAAALDGARWILMDEFSEDVELLGVLRQYLWDHAKIRSRVIEGRQEKGAKFADYFDAAEPIKGVPSHRALALFRGRKEGILRLGLVMEPPPGAPAGPAVSVSVPESADATALPAAPPTGELPREIPPVVEQRLADRFLKSGEGRPADAWLRETLRRAWKMKIFPHLQVDLESQVREQSEQEAIRVFARNLHDLLMAPPAGPRATLGLDPGLRTGVKAAFVDQTGQLLETATVYPHQPRNEWEPAIEALADLLARHPVDIVAIGNGTGSRETDRLIGDLRKRHPELAFNKIIVSEAGASVYSASKLALRELPGVDVTLRGAVSIARRLQDPLAELVKIEPRSIGVGQYQHDVNQAYLARALDGVVEDCVSAVGADLNTASPSLLRRVAGLNQRLAETLVAYRNVNGTFGDRQQLRQVPGFGARTFEQSAGFLRINGGANPLDASAVHPEAYPVVERICQATGKAVADLIGQPDLLRQFPAEQFADERFGVPTLCDILKELERPGRDPRPEFRMAAFREGVNEIEDLQPGMVLEGVVTNVTDFGAFVDIGVHQDGLVHVSRLANRFVKDPRDVVRTGTVVKVKVVEVDLKRRRIALSMRAAEARPAPQPRTPRPKAARPGDGQPTGRSRPAGQAPQPAREPVLRPPASETAMSAAFSRLLKRP